MSNLTVIASAPDTDGVAAAVVAARATGGPFQTFFFEPESLADFFARPVQSRLPGFYSLVLCGLEVAHMSWDGELLRPRLMDALRGFVSPVRWFSAHPWHSEDRAAVESLFGEGRLWVRADAACTAALVRDHYAASADEFAEQMVRLGAGAAGPAPCSWEGDWRRVIAALRAEPARLNDAVEPLLEGNLAGLDPALKEHAARVEHENREAAERNVEPPLDVAGRRLVVVSVPAERHAFWREISECARAQAGAELCLCHLAGRPVLILIRAPGESADLQGWAGYLTDLMPEALRVDERSGAVPLFIRGLDADPSLKREAVEILRDGAHLLAG